ncbi:hypothetical protein AM501_00670 [Aneurinibacillus migulanus]|uniref:DUF4062 domain-containing protein n=1 Tax=Aneurinibacillus migulanus TaxID=47500 RepID=UPI0006A10303|nr:DUF4062 domain-containing protein [Aneurinibacillus migulanus]KPD10096.1 hypothetical protein AM501_00670 [Aneurinibacillus migulanus]CEH28024.1 Uncharacterized protein BN1090_A2_00442 [Aneurinibacillus migulanus]
MPTKIFISSAVEDFLVPLRQTAFETLAQLGHSPEMWERTFGVGTVGIDSVQYCLEKVRECEIFFLFVHNKAGTYLTEAQSTVTHLEYREAIRHNKVIQVFVDRQIKSVYFSKAREIITKIREENNSSDPHILFRKLNSLYQSPDCSLELKQADAYVWILLYEVFEKHKPYAGEISAAGIDFKANLSELLRRASILLPKKAELEQNAEHALMYDKFFGTTSRLLEKLSIREIKDLRRFLTILREGFSGGDIAKKFGNFSKEDIGTFERCSAICIFKRNEDILECIALEGDTTEEQRFYSIHSNDSFVSTTYNEGNENGMLFYAEYKNQFYLTFKVNQYVVSYHFPASSEWNSDLFFNFQNQAISGILEAGANSLLCDFVNTVLGGLQDERETQEK